MLVAIGLLPSSSALSKIGSTEVREFIQKGLLSSNYTQAIQYYDKALALEPGNVAALTGKGIALDILGNYTQAITYLDKALALEPENDIALRVKGLALNSLSKYQEAITYFDKALAVEPTNVNALYGKGVALENLGNYTQAISYFDKVLARQPKHFGALAAKGLTLNSLGNYTQAISYFDKALAVEPEDIRALIGKGFTLGKLGNYTQAIQYYDKALAIEPKNVAALTSKGIALYSLGKYQEAIRYYDQVLIISPTDAAALNNKGNALVKLGNYIEAAKYYEKAIEILKSNHSNQSVRYSQTNTDISSTTNYKYAVANQDFLNIQYMQIADTQSTNIQDPKLVIAQINYARNLVNIGQYQLAITTYSIILQSDPYNGCALFGKADALDKSGQHVEAVKNYDIAKKLNPVCDTGPINIEKRVEQQSSQLGALAEGFSLLISRH